MTLPTKSEIAAWARKWAVAIVLVVIFFLFDRGPAMMDESWFGPKVLKELTDAQSVYRHLVTFSPLERPVSFVSVVSLSKKQLPPSAYQDACVARQYFSELLPRIAALLPKVIVLDLAFPKGGCVANPKATQNLAKAVHQAAARSSVVLGLSSQTVAEAIRSHDLSEERANLLHLQSNELIAFAHEDLGSTSGLDVKEGLIRVNEDPRKIPLNWLLRPEKNGEIQGESRLRRTLALDAALAYQDSSFLREVSQRTVHPLAVFAEPTEFLTVPADCVMNANNGAFDWNGSHCRVFGTRPNPTADMTASLGKLLRPIVIVGWIDDDKDFHKTPVGEIAGVYMQANFIESLTSERVLNPFPFSGQLFLSLIFFGVIDFQFWKFEVKKAAYWVIGSSLTLLILSYIAVHNFGYYIDLWPPSIAVVTLRSIQELLKGRTDKLATA
ncbi:MAG TPA: CHASE2 domain-containing protein [Bryobacteraceae bacterium]|jgi:CHASE2 domain-containing sensor protein